MNSGIYYITNPKGKLYIGSTKNFERRKSEYARAKCKEQKKVYNSIMKYGWEKHEFCEFIYCSEDVLLEREQAMLDFFKPELNINPIAAKPPTMKGKDHPFYGKKRSEQTKKKLSEALKGRPLSRPRTKEHQRKIGEALKIPVAQYNKNSEFIKEWCSATEAAKSLGIQRANITTACTGKRKSAGGFVWKYKDEKEALER